MISKLLNQNRSLFFLGFSVLSLGLGACGVDRSGPSANTLPGTGRVALTGEGSENPLGNSQGSLGEGTLREVESIPVGDTRCPAGGIRFEIADTGAQGSEHAGATHILCNGLNGRDGRDGQNGAAGEPGPSPLTQVVQIVQVSRTECPLGGYKIISFADADGDRKFNAEKGDKDFNETDTPICNASTGVRLLTENQWFSLDSSGECPAGGVISKTFGDLNHSGTVDADDVLANSTKICHRPLGTGAGEPIVVSETLPLGDADCPQGGKVIRSSRDQNRDGMPNTGDNNVTISKVCTNSMLDQSPRSSVTR